MPKKGYKLTKEHREKLSKAKMGKSSWLKGKHIQTNTGRTHFKKGQLPWNTGKKLGFIPCKAFKKGQIPWNKGKKCPWAKPPHYSGENHYNWKGGITPEIMAERHSLEYRIWRWEVFERDNYTCRFCGDDRGGNLEAHHLKLFSEFPELRFSVDNGLTLCKNCHTDIHKGKRFKN